MTAPAVPVLRLREVDVVRDGTPLLRSISLTVHQGEHWALLGSNGAGKSTLLSLAGALVHPTRGTVEVLGRTLGRVDLRELRSFVGHVDPRHPLRSPLRVRDVVLTGLTNTVEPVPRHRPSPDQRDRADRLLTTLGMGGKLDARWPTLSQGQRGRVLIARALMPLPRLLLLDEPATGLDLAAREQLLESLDTLRRDHPGLATVLVTHHLEELPASTTHAMLLRTGECLASGAVDEVVTTDHITKCFDYPVHISRTDGRWAARALRPPYQGSGS
ncbi:ABC transporter ATP-binding protein [Streptomyces rapamycinicus]|uniref:ABC transporter ATPase n=2 Tax=Streptomyces rapamycinicus TaxID=1226757 RepID=A0A0A0NJ70_STRRN|nr:ATP-binding cassette domain-containing protein [Streptomyces rapamycinicus]AGP54405.1 ABC transporter ATPase [Streptomyces rapamycinicus NRRL 5491]MBB4781910.1 iron complex transport system ATP-binding protein [Streptomyces rapamycinicus]RLV73448.1 ABC transporter ATPase [Streptomyces rapamycinicus NRRL 5491]UTO62463.1 ATP-binding cassette domain-containing protein [Streptomyces rapamycinicus]UTP30419.1 ATP-binding cassette domain-containing protein [Streptomyces rapamycinicus NRRL 5491]